MAMPAAVVAPEVLEFLAVDAVVLVGEVGQVVEVTVTVGVPSWLAVVVDAAVEAAVETATGAEREVVATEAARVAAREVVAREAAKVAAREPSSVWHSGSGLGSSWEPR